MTDVEFYKVGKGCIHQADVDAVVADVECAEVWRNHRDALTLHGRTMEGSDVK